MWLDSSSMDTVTHLRAQLRQHRGDWPAMCRATGLSYWWLTKFAQGRIAEPGLSKIEKLQVYFANHPLAEASAPEHPPAHRCTVANARDDGGATETDGIPVQPVSEAA